MEKASPAGDASIEESLKKAFLVSRNSVEVAAEKDEHLLTSSKPAHYRLMDVSV